MDPSSLVRCDSCSTHFALTPSMATDGMACPECGGRRLFRSQPSPTQSDGALRDMVDPISQIDQGGNPDGEGTIMNGGSAVKATQPFGKRDESFPASGTYGAVSEPKKVVHPLTFDTEPYDSLWHESSVKEAGPAAIPLALEAAPEVAAVADAAAPAIATGVGDLAGGVANAAKGLWSGVSGLFDSGPGKAAQLTGKAISPLMKGVLGAGGGDANGATSGAPNVAPSIMQVGAGLTKLAPGAVTPYQYENQQATLHGLPEPHVNTPWQALEQDLLPVGAAAAATLLPEGAAAAGAAEAGAADAAAGGAAAGALQKARGLVKGVGATNLLRPLEYGVIDHNNDAPASAPLQQPNPVPTLMQMGANAIPMILLGDFESPFSVPSVDEQHDDPEQQDQKQFHDGDQSPSNLENPSLDDSGANGEDNARSDAGFNEHSPGIERAQMIMPLLMHYYHSAESGESDPIIRGLHETLEKEIPGYLNHKGPDIDEALQALLHAHKNPSARGVHAGVNVMPGQAEPLAQGSGLCSQCGSTMNPGGSCPQCGAGQAQHPMQGGGQPALPPTAMPPAMAGLFLSNHQGPVTPEQIAAVQQLLVDHHRAEECPNVPLHPEQYAKEMAEITQQLNVPPQIDPSQMNQTPPQMPPGGQPGAMPMPDPSQPGAGGQPMQPMSSVREADANTVVPRCPECNSGSTSVDVAGADPSTITEPGGYCHACHKVFKISHEKTADANTTVPRCPECHSGSTTVDVAGADPSTVNEPGGYCHACHKVFKITKKRVVFADLVEMPNPHHQEDPHQRVWADNTGQDLIEGQTYELHSPSFPVPDVIKIMQVKPDSLSVQLADGAGIQTGHPDFEIPRQEAQLEHYQFIPEQPAAAPLDLEPPSGTPGQSPEQVPPIETTDTSPEVNPHTHASVQDPVTSDTCHCGSTMVDHTMSSPETTLHECVRCGKAWETHDEFEGRQAHIDLSWINESEDDNFFEDMDRHRAMAAVGSPSRNLATIAAKDERLQVIRQTLDERHEERTAGRHFNPSEKRDLIDEYGVARNLDDLDLNGTHYTAQYDMSGKANGDNVPDSHLLMGL